MFNSLSQLLESLCCLCSQGSPTPRGACGGIGPVLAGCSSSSQEKNCSDIKHDRECEVQVVDNQVPVQVVDKSALSI